MTDSVYSQRTLESFANDYQALTFVIAQLIGKIVTIVPVRVTAVTGSGSLASCPYVTVQPLLNQMTGNGQPIAHGIIGNVPVWRMQSGSSAIVVDPVVGDTGLMLVAYRDSSNLVATDQSSPGSLQGGAGTTNPGSSAQYDWGSGWYLGGWLNGAVSQYIQLTADLCKIVAPNINLNGLTIDSSGNLNTSGNVTSNGVTLKTHEHSAGTYVAGSNAVTGDSGAPT